ncbi:MAG: OsmC family protein [Acidobacteriia bacterium]|nr:OsmC family protein [Terriglobia bacterium]
MEHKYTYLVNGLSTTVRSGTLAAPEVQTAIAFSAPPEFYGQPGQWTPEHLFVASVASCFISTFSGMADYSKLEFRSLSLEVEGVIEKDEGGWRFTRVVVRPRLKIAHAQDGERANRLLQKAEKACLVARSLACPVALEQAVETLG